MKHIYLFTFLSLFCIGIANAQTVTPEVDGSSYSLTFSDIVMTVDANEGANVVTMTLNGENFIVPESTGGGSVLWPAPQSEFANGNWPPPADIDDGTYTASVEENIMTFVSAVDQDGLGNDMQVIKNYWADEADTSITILYELVNKGNDDITKALWELTRVPVNGLTFWPTGEEGAWGELASSTVEEAGHTWIDITAEPRSNLKFFADGSDGWMAHIDTDRRLFIKSFENVDQSQFASGEGEIELWIAGNYIELENLSAAHTLSTDDTMRYEMKWILRQLPESVDLEIGNTMLIDYVNWVLNGGDMPTSVKNYTQADGEKLVIFPNPANNTIQIENSVAESEATLHIFNTAGKLVLSRQLQENNSIDISTLTSGVYQITLVSGGTVRSTRFVKN